MVRANASSWLASFLADEPQTTLCSLCRALSRVGNNGCRDVLSALQVGRGGILGYSLEVILFIEQLATLFSPCSV